MTPALTSLLRPALLGLLLLAGGAAAVGTPAGTTITNRAAAVYVSPNPTDAQESASNVVSTTVQAVCAVSVTPDGTAAQPARQAFLLPGERVVFPYTVVNAGNAPATLPVQASATGSVTPTLRVVLDANRDGDVGADEPTVDRVTLDADASADVLLVVDAGPLPGDADVNLTAGCAGGMTDAANVSRVRVGPAPELAVSKAFTPALVRPGTETTVTVTATNGGAGDSREVTVTDDLGAQAAAGLTFVPGSARASVGTVEYSTDGRTWTATEVQPVRAVRARVPSLAAGASVTVTFRMLAGAAAENKVIPNTATATTGSATVSADASADVRYSPAVALGPVGEPRAADGTAADAQTRPFAVAGQAACFDHTLLNTGDVRDAYTVTVTYPQGAATSTVLGADGAVLAQPVTLDPGQSVVVRVCHAAQPGPLTAEVTATGARGPVNATRDVVAVVEAGLPELKKAYAATTVSDAGQTVTVPDGQTVAVGDTVTYTLTVRNPYAHALTAAVVRDPLPAHVDAVSASDGGVTGGTPGAQVVTWTLGTVAPGETRTLTVVATVSARAVDGEALENTFTLASAELAGPLPSNTVRTPVWSAKLRITKTVSAPQATFGDVLTYTLTITNASATTAIVNADVTDTPATGLAYVPGSSTVNGAALADPAAVDGALRWTLAELPAGRTVTITYRTRVTPEATGDLENAVVVSGTGAGGVARAVASNRAVAVIKLNPLLFAPLADIVGVVYVDRNRNGTFDPGLDTPVPRARILLAGGRQVLTDPHGRYAFPNVPQGPHALRLDPHTTPYPALGVPGDSGPAGGTRSVYLRGLTSVDFPLAPLGGDIDAVRHTTLTLGDVSVVKTVFAVPGGYAVTLRVTTPRPLEGVQLDDPLPPGATVKDGRHTYTGTLDAGEFTLAYTVEWAGEPRAATTDPVMSWRY